MIYIRKNTNNAPYNKIKLKNNEIKHGIVLHQRDAFKIETKPRQIYNFLLQLYKNIIIIRASLMITFHLR